MYFFGVFIAQLQKNKLCLPKIEIMKYVLFFACFLFGIYGAEVNAQKKRTTTKRTTSSKKGTAKKSKGKTKSVGGSKIQTDGGSELDLFSCIEGGPCTFTILNGDTVVYTVNTSGQTYDLFVVVNKFNGEALVDFNWYTSAPNNQSGKVTINTTGIKSSKQYTSLLAPGALQLNTGSAIWFTQANYKESSAKETTIAFDAGTPEKFFSPEVDAVETPINFRGKQVNLEGFALQNKNEGEAGRKEIWVLNASLNLLILKMNTDNMSMQIKEIRSTPR
jgi:hypothetical protein